MKTRELIRQLQEADPSGEDECVIHGEDIGAVYSTEGYWDGPYQVLVRNENGRSVGARWTTRGRKVVLRPYSLEDLLLDLPEAKVEVDVTYSDPKRKVEMEADVERIRAEMKEIKEQVRHAPTIVIQNSHAEALLAVLQAARALTDEPALLADYMATLTPLLDAVHGFDELMNKR